ncbi:hypothetical protein CEXT_23471 [Caerostris extrusa]|uniref:Uncharacterized protein n=1 Tax=Caerostris extrusa TaxID=172846 RepID=A0AAV4P8A8_CAEEX|nr:hypothetical protein CEXT_23471 [Caerostris extrusa]
MLQQEPDGCDIPYAIFMDEKACTEGLVLTGSEKRLSRDNFYSSGAKGVSSFLPFLSRSRAVRELLERAILFQQFSSGSALPKKGEKKRKRGKWPKIRRRKINRKKKENSSLS